MCLLLNTPSAPLEAGRGREEERREKRMITTKHLEKRGRGEETQRRREAEEKRGRG